MNTTQRASSPVIGPRARVPHEVGRLDPIRQFSETRRVDEFCHSADRRIITRPRSRASIAACLGVALFTSAVVTHLIFFRRAKRHLGFG